MGYPVVHFEIQTPDPAKLHRFYTELFGWSVQLFPEMGYSLVDTHADGKGIAGGIGSSQGGANRVTFYVEVPNVAEALKKAEGLGATTVMPETTIPNMVTLGMFADPEGNFIGLIKREAPGS